MTQEVPATPRGSRRGLVLAGGGARGAYEAGVLAHVFEHVLPRLDPAAKLDVLSGTSVGAVHAAYAAASGEMEPVERARRITDTWESMRIGDVVRFSPRDLLGLPLRALGLSGRAHRVRTGEGAELIGGLLDVTPLEQLVSERIPWSDLRQSLWSQGGRALCVSCTDVRTGRCTIFIDGQLAETEPWGHDRHARAIHTSIEPVHVRASAAIPFLFPAVKIGDRFYVDGGLRMNTPLSPALRLGCNRVLVVALKHRWSVDDPEDDFPDDVITQPAFMVGKVLDSMMLDQLEIELQRLELVNAILKRGESAFGDAFLPQINEAVREQRGVGFRHIHTCVVRPREDLGSIAADCYRKSGGRDVLGTLPSMLARLALQGTPEREADLLSYLYFDRSFTGELLALGREDARRQEDELAELFATRSAADT